MTKFVHLRSHSEYSIQDGINRVDELVKLATKDGMPALALTDLNNIFGMLKFYKSARSKGVKPVIGSEVYIENEEESNKPHRLLLLVRNLEGYKRLNHLLSRAYTENQIDGKACLKKQWLKEEKGMVALSGALKGEAGYYFLKKDIDKMRGSLDFYNRCFPGAFFIEIQRYGHAMEEMYIDEAISSAIDMDIPVVATHPIQFPSKDDYLAHDIRMCIAEKRQVSEKERSELFTGEQYFKTTEEMTELFKDIPEALDNSYEIAKMCNLTVTLGKSFLPDFPVPEGMTLDEFIRHESEKGLQKRMAVLYPDPKIRSEKYPEYQSRLDFELSTIKNMGFSGYFLIVADFINWGKNNGVPVGPGRGSGAGSLVAYSLGITDLDPLAYSLLFERFLNPERVSMPDFDVDFCQENRGRVIDYVRNKYGHDSVSQIATFGTMASKAALKDVGRALGLSYGFCDNLSKAIPIVQNVPISLSDALKESPELANKYSQDEEARNLFDQAIKLEGISKSVGMHAGGVLIAPGKISDFCPLYMADKGTVSQFDKDDVESIGLVKFDFLGLRNLTIIDLAVRYIKERKPDFNQKMEELSFDDENVYDLLKAGNTSSVFQLESEGMKKLMLKLKPDTFEDIIAALALYRPGPLGSGMVDDFILRKKGKQKIDYFHDSLKATLNPTYGVVVYQEQVMQIAQVIAGYTLGGADMLRRAMGKKKPEEMAKQRSIFVEGAVKNGHSEAFASSLFDLMAKFAEYGFNKSHSAAYAVITYQTAWLKRYHCADFLAATLSSDMADTDSVKVFYDDAIANGLKILPPDINRSDYAFIPESDTEIRYGLGAIKGVGDRVSKQIMDTRKTGPFKDLFDFCARMPKGSLDKRIMEGLIKAGAFDSLDKDRAKLIATSAVAVESSKTINTNQGSLFDDLPVMSTQNYVAAEPWSKKKTLEEEKSVLGFYVSGHPFSNYEKEFAHFRGQTKNAHLTIQPELFPVAGTLTGVEKKSSMYILKVDDGTAIVPVAVFKDMYEENAHLMRMDNPILIYVETKKDNFNDAVSCRAKKMHGINDLRSQYVESVVIDIHDDFVKKIDSRVLISKLRQILKSHISENGKIGVIVQYTKENETTQMSLDPSWSFEFNNDMLKELKQVFGNNSVILKYGSGKLPETKKRRFAA